MKLCHLRDMVAMAASALEFAAGKIARHTPTVLGRRGYPLAGAKSLAGLANAEWATTSITREAEEEMGELFRAHGPGAARLVLPSQSALTLMAALAHSDLLAMAQCGGRGSRPRLACCESPRCGKPRRRR